MKFKHLNHEFYLDFGSSSCHPESKSQIGTCDVKPWIKIGDIWRRLFVPMDQVIDKIKTFDNEVDMFHYLNEVSM